MQNKPNLPEGEIDAKCVFTKDYENKWQRRVRENKPNSKPNKPNLTTEVSPQDALRQRQKTGIIFTIFGVLRQ